jgi:hypothetical protein
MAFPMYRDPKPLRAIYESANYETVMTFDRFDELFTMVAYELKVPASKLRVTDRFDNELKPKEDPRYDLGFASLAIYLDAAMKRHSRKDERGIIQTVDEYLRLMNEVY